MELKDYNFFQGDHFSQWLYSRHWGYNAIMRYIDSDFITAVATCNLEMESLHQERIKFFFRFEVWKIKIIFMV